MPKNSDTFTAPEIRTAIEKVHRESVEYWNSFDSKTFFAPIGEAWSPSENVRHLSKSIRAVATGLRLPKVALMLRFGRPRHESRSYTEVVEVYQAKLDAGGKAGKFTPNKQGVPDDIELERSKIMEFHKDAVEGLCSAIERWPERTLDRRQMPHPLIGNLTVREMLLFTLYHNQHHVENVRRGIGAPV